MARALFSLFLVTTLGSCSTVAIVPKTAAGNADAGNALAYLRDSRFDDAEAEALQLLANNPDEPVANTVAAITRYKKTMHNLVFDAMSIFAGVMFTRTVNHRYARWSLADAEASMAAIEAHLERACGSPDFTMELCLACWRVDWIRDGRINDRDQALLEVEYDADGSYIDEDDPRRRPTFRFDYGDLYWARAMIGFQRAALQLVLAYDFTELDNLILREFSNVERSVITLKLVESERIASVRSLLLAGFAHADAARQAYLAETDDQGEWVPNPKQKDHPLPLPVTAELFGTWESALGDAIALVSGKEGISVAEVAQLGDHQWQDPPQGYVDIGKLLDAPGDIVLNLGHLEALGGERSRADAERVLRDIFGDKYVRQMPASSLTKTFARMKQEVEAGQESFERKLRYLLWLN